MKIVEEGSEKTFTIGQKGEIKVIIDNDGGIEFYDEEDPIHTGYYLNDIQEFYYFINGLTEIAKKIKEEEECKKLEIL